MSQDFKLKFDSMRSSNPTAEGDAEAAEANANYTYSTARNVCFVWANGQRLFLAYSYLIGAEYNPAEAVIILHFTSHNITLKGYHLDKLFDDFMMHLPRIIASSDPRYNATLNVDTDVIVNEIVSVAV